MERLKKSLIGTLSLALLGGSFVFAGIGGGEASPPGPDVRVVNTTAEPVPTRAQGTTVVAGTVQAQQSGNWSVGISGTPVVNVGNSIENPVWVRDADNHAPQPFAQGLALNMSQGQLLGLVGFQVPAGKRLVIEFISANAEIPVGEKDVFLIQANANSIGYTHYLTATYQANFSGLDDFVISQPIRMCADPSTTVRFQIVRSAASGVAGFNFNISGYLIDAT